MRKQPVTHSSSVENVTGLKTDFFNLGQGGGGVKVLSSCRLAAVNE